MKIGEKTINVKGKVGEEKDLNRKEIIFFMQLHMHNRNPLMVR